MGKEKMDASEVLISRSPFQVQKKILPIMWFMVIKTIGLNPGFLCKNQFGKYAAGPEILAKMDVCM